jgi:Zn-dependent protease with chaperone function
MRFEPKTPKEAINYTRENPLREIVILVVATTAIAMVVFFSLGQVIEFAVPRIPPTWEVRVFSGVGRLLHADGDVSVDPQLQELVNRLAASWPDCPYVFEISIDGSPEPNAFAIPGGRILVTRGLLEQAESENELAFVLAHELGHFRGRDHLAAIGRASAFALLRIGVSSLTGMGVPQGLGWAELLTTSGFSRAQESNADEFALGLVHAEYGHLGGAFDFFRRDSGDAVGKDLVGWISTHPISDDRVATLEELGRSRGWSLSGTNRPAIQSNNSND